MGKMEIAIFTKEVADCLQARGFELIRTGGKSNNIYYFEDSKHLTIALDEIISGLTLL